MKIEVTITDDAGNVQQYVEMDINNKLTELIDGVNNGEIETLAELQRELIYFRSEIQALRIHDIVGQSEQLCDFLEWK